MPSSEYPKKLYKADGTEVEVGSAREEIERAFNGGYSPVKPAAQVKAREVVEKEQAKQA